MSRDNKQAATKEKQLKSIYELLNRGCNKKAVQDIDKFPKNLKELTVFKALKSLALIRMCKRVQAFEVLGEIDLDDDLDEVTLQTMTSCYKEAVDVDKIVDLYEAASRRKPNDQEIMARLFMAHVRVFNFKRQKEIALLMYKNFPKKKRLYFFWAIMSLVMQSQETIGDQAEADKKVCLTLAERMCDKMIEDERTQEEIELYLTILQKQNKYEEEYRFLTGPLCSRLTDHLSWFNRRRAYLCLDLKMYSRAFKHYFVTLIQEYPDQIEYYQGLFKSALLLDTKALSQQQSPVAPNEQQTQSVAVAAIANQPTSTPVKTTSALAECYDIVEKQCLLTLDAPDGGKDQQKGKSLAKNLSRTSSLNPNRKRLLRGPFIARAELFHTIVSNENVLPKNVFIACMNQFANKYPTLVSLLLDYFQSFSKKIICFYDLVYMVNEYKLSEDDKQSLVAAVHEWVDNISQNNTESISPSDISNIILNGQMLEHMLHDYKVTDSKEMRLSLAEKYIGLYHSNKNLGNFKTEYLAFDNYCLLAINAIMTNAIDLNDITSQSILTDSVIISLIALAEDAISYSNHHVKLTLLKLYSFIGASKQSSEQLVSMDIKHFQIDTLGHLLNPVLYNTGGYSLSRDTLDTCLDFYTLGIRECFEGLTTSYRDGRFSKVEEISSVFKRLNDSLNATQCFLLKGIVDNLSAESLDELHGAYRVFDSFRGLYRIFRESEKTINIRDNRDFKVLKSLNVETDNLVQKRQSQNLEDEQIWLTLRYYLLRSVFLQLNHHNVTASNIALSDDDAQEKYLKELKFAQELIENLRPSLDEAISNVTDFRFSYFEPESSPFRWKHVNFQLLISLVEDIAFLPDSSSLTPEIQDNYNMHLEAIVNDVEAQLSCIGSLMEMKQALIHLTISLEFISLAITSIVAINQPNISGPATSTKKSSASNQQAQLVRTKTLPHKMIAKTEAQLARISQSIKNINIRASILDKVTEPEMQVKMDTFCKIKEKIFENYHEALEEIETICRRKTKLLRCLSS